MSRVPALTPHIPQFLHIFPLIYPSSSVSAVIFLIRRMTKRGFTNTSSEFAFIGEPSALFSFLFLFFSASRGNP